MTASRFRFCSNILLIVVLVSVTYGCAPTHSYLDTPPPVPYSQTAIGAARWVEVYSDAGRTMNLDTTRIEQVRGYRQPRYSVWIRSQYTNDQQGTKPAFTPEANLSMEPFTYQTALVEWYVGCEDGRLQSRRAIYYGADGTSVVNSTDMAGNYKRPAPDTIGEVLVRETCRILGQLSR